MNLRPFCLGKMQYCKLRKPRRCKPIPSILPFSIPLIMHGVTDEPGGTIPRNVRPFSLFELLIVAINHVLFP